MTGPRIKDAFVVARPAGVRVRTRLKPTVSEADALNEIGAHLGGLARADLADRVRVGDVRVKDNERARRKNGLTGQCSSRWAGSITRASQDQYALAVRSLDANIESLTRATRKIRARLAVPVGESNGLKKHARVTGYRSKQEWFAKSRRLAQLTERLKTAQARRNTGRPNMVVGGGRLWRNRQHLAAAELTEPEWRERWDAARLFLTADGETGKRYGNETIRVVPQEDGTGTVRLKTPEPLAAKYGKHVTFTLPVSLETVHRGGQWSDRVHANQCVRYDISYNVDKGRWYLDASWGYPKPEHVPTVDQLQSSLVLGVDLNADHLAGYVTDPSGNPVGDPITIPLELKGLSKTTRDARLRDAISRLLRVAQRRGSIVIAIENLNFADARETGRETMGRGRKGKRFRRTVAGIPTAQFRDRLAAMAATQGIWILAVDPRNTSKHGKKHWLPEIARRHNSRLAVTGHHSAATTISRRARKLRITRTRHSPDVTRGSRPASARRFPQQKLNTPVGLPTVSHPPPDRAALIETG